MTLQSRLTAGERWPGDNAEVLAALGFVKVDRLDRATMTRDAFEYYIRGDQHVCDCRPLDSVDDGLRLVPEGWFTDETSQNCYHGDWFWSLHRNGLWRVADVQGRAPTAAVALCIAILRARETENG